MSVHKIAIVGAGMSGISAARTLCGEGFDVQIFEKSRGYGGRMATRRASGFEFDHGAQYFTARDSTFRRYVVEWVREGVAAVWQGEISVIKSGQTRPAKGDQPRYVGTPRMNSVVRHLARDIKIEFGARIISLEKDNRRWRLISERGCASGPVRLGHTHDPSLSSVRVAGTKRPAAACPQDTYAPLLGTHDRL